LTIYKYPLKAPVSNGGNKTVEGPTEAIDYLCLRRSRIIYASDGNKSISSSHHRHDPNASQVNQNIKRKSDPNIAYLAMPPQLSTSYQAAYSHQDIGVAGLGLVDAWNSEDMTSLTGIVQSAAGMGLPEFASSTAANIASAFGNQLGMAGKIDANSLQQMTKGRVFNPFAEQIFKSMAFRQHAFNFKLFAHSMNEAREIFSIINWIKEGATPKIEGGSSGVKDFLPIDNLSKTVKGAGDVVDNTDEQKNVSIEYTKMLEQSKSQRYFNVPDQFDLKFLRVKPGDENNWWNPTGEYDDGSSTTSMHFKIHPSFCNNVGINYTPDGQYTSFKSIRGNQIQVPVVQLSLQFIETRLVSQQDVKRGY